MKRQAAGNPNVTGRHLAGADVSERKKSSTDMVDTPKIEDIKARLVQAAAAGDLATIRSLAKEAEAEERAAEQAAREQLAKAREALATRIIEAVRSPLAPFKAEIEKFGGVCRLTAIPADEKYLSAVIGAAAAPRVAATGGSAKKGSAMQRFGAPLGAIFAQYATPEEKAAHDAVPDGPSKNSKQWAIKKAVENRCLAEGLIKEIPA